jgi:hypothetical protein
MRRLRILSLVVGLIALAAGPALAQAVGATTGAINGKVSDATGGVMPGVTVTISSPSMQGVRTAVTNEEGSYRFPAIPPGEYKMTYELEGFSTVVREGIRVGLGFTATVNTELKVASLTESVISGQSPVVDITSTKTATNFDAKELRRCPARAILAILARRLADAAHRRRRQRRGHADRLFHLRHEGRSASADGRRHRQHRRTNAAYYYDYGSFDEVSVATDHTAEMPWPGVMSQFIQVWREHLSREDPADNERENIQSRTSTTRSLD